jgi:branched-chain amino acid transport system substrate-binding protein
LRKGWPTGHLSAQASIQNFQKLGALLRGYLWPWIGLIGIGGLLLSVGGYWQHLQKRQTLNAVEPMTSANQLRRFSLGDKILITADSSIDKQEGVKLFQQGRFLEAVSRFEAALNQSRNDPESRIYLNNARAAAKANPVKIAVSAPIGGNVNVAKEILRGAAQYQYEINGGKGIQGRGLQILVADDENDPDVAEQIAVSLSEDKSVLAVIGHQSSDTSIAAAPIYQKAGVVMISPTSYARQLSSIGNFIFRTTPNSYAIASRLARYTVNTLHYQKVAICIDTQSQASASYRDDFIAAFYEQGGQITRTMCDFSSADFNPNTIASQAIRDGASGLLLVPPVERLGRAIDVMQANKGKIPLLGGPSMYTFEILQKGLVNANGMTLAVAWAPSEAKGSSYSAIAQKLWGGSGSWRTAMAYDAVKSVVTGLQRAQNRKQLQETLSNPEFTIPGATGIIQFMPTGDRNKAGTLVKILPGKNSGVGYDFVTVKP